MEQPAASSPLAQETIPLLRTRRFGRRLQVHDRVASTNTLAAAWAAEGAPEGSVVAAEYQTAGRGRLGRSWEAAAGQNLTFSLLLRPPLPPERLGLLTLAASVAVAEAIDVFTAPLVPAIKWPNDLLLEGRKCCGILLESSLPAAPAASATVILGIGLNVNQAAFPPALADRATSLLLATGRPAPRPALFARLLLQLEQAYDRLLAGGDRPIRQAYEARLAGVGQPLMLHLPGAAAPVEGILEGITEAGALRLRTRDGLCVFHAGEVSTRSGPDSHI